MFKAKIYGDFGVKFRAFGVDFGYVKKSISLANAVVFDTPIAVPSTIPISFDRFGVRLNAFVVRA